MIFVQLMKDHSLKCSVINLTHCTMFNIITPPLYVCENYYGNAVSTTSDRVYNLTYAGAILRRTTSSLRSLDYVIANANCTGDEHSLFNCSYIAVNSGHNCDGFEAGVICQGKTTYNMIPFSFLSLVPVHDATLAACHAQ